MVSADLTRELQAAGLRLDESDPEVVALRRVARGEIVCRMSASGTTEREIRREISRYKATTNGEGDEV